MSSLTVVEDFYVRGGPVWLDSDECLLSEIFCLTILKRDGAEDDQEKATQSFLGVQSQGGAGSLEGRAHPG